MRQETTTHGLSAEDSTRAPTVEHPFTARTEGGNQKRNARRRKRGRLRHEFLRDNALGETAEFPVEFLLTFRGQVPAPAVLLSLCVHATTTGTRVTPPITFDEIGLLAGVHHDTAERTVGWLVSHGWIRARLDDAGRVTCDLNPAWEREA